MSNDFFDDEPTKPIPSETLAEITARWRISQTDAMPEPIATSERPTKNIRPIRSHDITVVIPLTEAL